MIFDGVVQHLPNVDIVRVQDVGLLGADDPTILAWAAEQGRILLTNDKKTIPDFVYERLNQGLTTPGAMIFRPNIPLGTLITEILTIAEASKPEEWQNLVTYIPL
jgi:hypothetical protein